MSNKTTSNTVNKPDNVLQTKEEAKQSVNLEEFLHSLSPQQQKIINKFMENEVFEKFKTYLLKSITGTHNQIWINCYVFRAKKDFNIRIDGKIYECKANCIIYIQKDAYGNSLLRNPNVERIA